MEVMEEELMARPIKSGLDYFTLDTDIDNDPKIEFLEAKHGLQGFAIFIRLLARIYRAGYYLQWGEREALVLSKRINVNINSINEVVNDCLNEGLFDPIQYTNHRILTSTGIQKRFLAGTIRRKEVSLYKEYLLLTASEVNSIHPDAVIVSINRVNVDINPAQLELIHAKVHKGKESKEKEIKIISMSDAPLFQEFWQAYPTRKGKKLGKPTAFRYFLSIKQEEWPLVVAAAKNYASSEAVQKGIGIKDPERFLFTGRGDERYEFWREWIEPEADGQQRVITDSEIDDWARGEV